METAPPGPGPAQEESLQTFSLNLISLIRTAQGQNGVKHGDYSRYRRHCKNKLKALYKNLKFQHGRTKFIKRKVEVHTVTDVRFLHIPIFNAERAWAYAKEFKKEMEGSVDLKKRRHMVARMNKAARWAKELALLATQRCDARGCVEAQAYAAYLAGSALAEAEKDWHKALALLTRARHILSQLARQGGSAESQALYLQQIEDIEPTIRYCSYQITRQGAPEPSEAQLLAQAEKEDFSLPSAQLQAHIAEAGTEAAPAPSNSGLSLTPISTTFLQWMGQNVIVRHERLKTAVQQVRELESQVGAVMDTDSSAEGGPDPRITLYEKLGRALTEAVTVARLAIKASTAPEGDPGRTELEAAEVALVGLKATKAVEQAQVQVSDAESRFAASLDKAAGAVAKKGGKERRSDCRPEEVVRHLDSLSRALAELGDLAVRAGGQAGEHLYDQTTAKSACVRAARAYYTAQYLLAAGRTAEAYALFGRVSEHIQTAKGEQPTPEDLQRLTVLATSAATYQSVAQAEHAASQARQRQGLEEGLGGLGLTDSQGKALDPQQPKFLLDALDSWESFVGGKQPRIYQLPYAMQAFPCRPIMVDTAASHLSYPNIEHRIKKETKKGVLSSLGLGWGLGWGAKK